jgi:hypothetical protein
MTLLKDFTSTAYQVGGYCLHASDKALNLVLYGINCGMLPASWPPQIVHNAVNNTCRIIAAIDAIGKLSVDSAIGSRTPLLKNTSEILKTALTCARVGLNIVILKELSSHVVEVGKICSIINARVTDFSNGIASGVNITHDDIKDIIKHVTVWCGVIGISWFDWTYPIPVTLDQANLELINGQNALRMASEAFERQLPREMEALRRELKIAQDANCKLQAEKDSCLYSLRNSDENFHSQREIIKQLTQQKQDLEEALDAQKNSLQAAKIDAKQYVSLINEKLDSVDQQVQGLDESIFHQECVWQPQSSKQALDAASQLYGELEAKDIDYDDSP